MTKPIVLDIPFAAGIDESQRPELLDPRAGFTTLENVRQTKRGGISKRYGFSALTLTRLDATSRSAAYKLFAHRDQTCVIDGTKLDAYSPAASVWTTRDLVPQPLCMFRGLPAIHAEFATDVIYCNGYVVAATVRENTSGNKDLVASVVDATTFEVLKQWTVESNFSAHWMSVKLGMLSTDVVVFYQYATNDIRARTLSVANASGINAGWSSSTTVANDMTGDGIFDVVSMSDRIAFAYVNTSAGTDRVSIETINASRTTLESGTVNTSSVTPDSVALAGSIADTLWVAWNEAGDILAEGRDADALASITATSNVVISASSGDARVAGIAVTGTEIAVAYGYGTASYELLAGRWAITAGAVNPAFSAKCPRVGMVGRPFVTGGRTYLACCHLDSSYISSLVADGDWTRYVADVTISTSGSYWTDGQPITAVANMTQGTAYATEYVIASMPPHNVELGGGKFGVFHRTVQRRTGAATSAVDAAAGIEVLDFASSQRWQSLEHAGKTLLAGGVTTLYDGEDVFEAGFLCRPAKPTLNTAGAGVMSTSTSTGYLYLVVYEHVDVTGEVHVSGTSDPSAGTGTITNKSVVVTVANLTLTSRYSDNGTPVRVALYRTTDGGSTYYRLADWENDPTTATTTYTDNSTASIASNPKLHRQPGTLGTGQDRRSPPSSRCATVYNDMVVVASDVPDTIWHSAAKVPGEGLWFNPVWQFQVLGAREITALAAQDGTLFVFSRTGIWAVNGEPPSDNGAAGGFGTPRQLACDVGCIDARSVVVTSLGIMFQSSRGLELLTRAQSVEWLGEPVQDTVASYPVCTAATLDSAAGVVLFEMASAESSNQVSGTGRTLVFDLTIRAWVSTDRRKNSAGTADTPAQGGAMVYTGSAWRYAWLGTDGRAYVEDQTTHLDPGSAWVTMKASTSWIHTAGPQGEQFLRGIMALAERHTGHDLTLSAYHDYVDSSPGSKTFSAASIAALSRQWLEYPTAKARGAAVKVVVQDATPSSGTVGTGKGSTWIGLSFPGLPHAGAKRTSTAHRGA